MSPIIMFQEKKPKVHKDAYVSPQATLVGDVEVGEYSNIWPGSVIRGDFAKVQIGAYTNIQDGCVVHAHTADTPVIVGNFVTVGSNVVMHGCYCGDAVVIGDGVIIYEGVTIGEGALVSPGSILVQNMVIPPRLTVSGAPAKQIRELSREDITRQKERAEIIARVFYKLRRWLPSESTL
jgi:carbonic anhydrase/acetyltransferase-like protein (isoleucine patch superfamily)